MPIFETLPNDSIARFVQLNELMSDNKTILIDGYGNSSDWIEIYNSAKDSISLSGFTLSNNFDEIDKWSFPDVYIKSEEYLIVYASNNESSATELHTNFQISPTGERILFYYKGLLLDSAPSINLEEDQSLIKIDGIWEKALITTPGKINIIPDLDYPSISINEVYNGDTDTLVGTVESHEWIELYNGGDESVDLSGLYLTDNEDLTRWRFPSNDSSIIAAKGFLIVYGDKDPSHTEILEANFKKIKTGDVISLSKVRGLDTTVLSSLVTPGSLTSQGRLPDGSATIVLFDYHSFNSINTLDLDCNGDEKGEALLDQCGVCSGGNTGVEIDACIIPDFDYSLISINEIENITLDSLDIITVKRLRYMPSVATILGEVYFPGDYPISDNETFTSLLNRAGGFKDNSGLKNTLPSV